MRDLIRGEIVKMTTTRSSRLLVAAALAVPLLTVFAANSADPAEAARPLSEQQSWFFTVALSRVVFALVGLRVLAEEYRFRTLAPTMLAAGSRGRLFAAKGLAAFAAAAALAALTSCTFLAAAAAYWQLSAGSGVTVGGEFAGAALRLVVGAGLWGLVGLGVAGVVKHALPATVGIVVWLMIVEDVLRLGIGDAVAWLPGQAGLAFAVDVEVPGVSSSSGGVRLLLWTVMLLVPASALVRARDVT